MCEASHLDDITYYILNMNSIFIVENNGHHSFSFKNELSKLSKCMQNEINSPQNTGHSINTNHEIYFNERVLQTQSTQCNYIQPYFNSITKLRGS